MAKVLIFGNGEIAEVAHIYLSHDSEHEIVGFTLDHAYRSHDYFRGLPVITFESLQESYPPDEFELFIPISFRDLNSHRANKFKQAKEMGYKMISYISSKAMIMPETHIGENCFIFENNVIQPKVSVDDNCIIWSGNHIGHHSKIGKHCFIASHAVISGHVSIGDYTFIGVNATIRDNIDIAAKNVIGAGATILHSTKVGEVYKGIAATKASISSDQIKW
ncbi:MAG: acetyltransferase [Enterobacterales bacterium]|nr:acetyltransferase [Enterobacterales bacterium]